MLKRLVTFSILLLLIPGFGSSEWLLAEEKNDSASKGGESPLILAHYMPWYAAKPFSSQWGWHWTMNHFDPEARDEQGNRKVASKYNPLIGPYDSADPDLLEYHLLLMKLAGIDGVIVDWYGLTDFRDYATLHHCTTRMLEHCERFDMTFVLCYEDQTVPALVEAGRLKPDQRVQHVAEELQWLGKYWFKSGSYLKRDGKPVLLSFGHAGLTDEEWERSLKAIGFPLDYFSQAYRREGAAGGFDWPVPQRGLAQVDQFLKLAADWPQAIPVAFPRFDDIYQEAGVGDGYPLIPDNEGQTFQVTLRKAIAAERDFIQLATWNDWGEGTQIEPSVEFGFRDLEWMQQLRRQQRGPKFAATSADLRIPAEIYRLRKSANPPTIDLDRLAALISSGQWSAARQLWTQLAVRP